MTATFLLVAFSQLGIAGNESSCTPLLGASNVANCGALLWVGTLLWMEALS
jgi:hypothetical protein